MYWKILTHIIPILLTVITGIAQPDRNHLSEPLFITASVIEDNARLSSVEICDNGIDDDGDGFIDCADGDCEVLLNGGFEDVPTNTIPGSFITFPQYPIFLGSWAAVNIDGEVFFQSAGRPAYEGDRYASLLQNSGANPIEPWNENSWAAGGYDRFLFLANTLPNSDYNMTFYHAGDDRYDYLADRTLVQVQSLDTDFYMDTLINTPGYFDWTAVSLSFRTDETTNSVAILFSSVSPDNSSVVLDDLKFCGPRVPEVVAVTDHDTIEFNASKQLDVLANDLNLPDTLLSIQMPETGFSAHGTLVLHEDGTVLYTPNSGFAGIDSFEYTICNNGVAPVQCSSAYVYIYVLEPPLQPEIDTFYIIMKEDEQYQFCREAYFDLEQPVTSILVCEEGDYGVCVQEDYACINYLPNLDYNGMDAICLVVCSENTCDTSVFVIRIVPVNDPPNIRDDAATTGYDHAVDISILINDSDERDNGEIDPLSVIIESDPKHGEVIYHYDGTVTYMPDSDFSGTDQFTYTVCDLGTPMPALCNSAEVVIDIEAAEGGEEEVSCMIPHSFSPNRDNLYDYFTIGCADYYPEMVLHIYDRFGNQMYHSEPGYRNDWDGVAMRNNKPLREGTYYWIVSFNDGHTKDRAGYVLLWR